jgi:hypothetical protein
VRSIWKTICLELNYKILGGRVDFVANLIVLNSKGIDVILGMYWLSKHKIPIDCAKKSFKLTAEDRKELSVSQRL